MISWKLLKHNPSLWNTVFLREQIVRSIREFFYKEKFHEVQTPLLVPSVIPESYLEVFKTDLLDRNRKKKSMFFTTSPEVSLKKLLVAGIGDVFEITKSFRNTETDSKTHRPEFSILEWYRVGATYKDLMKDCENLIMYIYSNILNRKNGLHDHFTYQNQSLDLSIPWKRISMTEAFKKYAHIDLHAAIGSTGSFHSKNIAHIAKKRGYQVSEENSWEEIFNQIFLNEVEIHLGTHGFPTIIYDYPKPLAALSKLKRNDNRFTQRFEVYIGGLELIDGCTELTDWKEQKQRFDDEFSEIKKRKKTPIIADLDFIDALKSGLPNCAGAAMGIDRLVMFFSNSPRIDEVMLFPLS